MKETTPLFLPNWYIILTQCQGRNNRQWLGHTCYVWGHSLKIGRSIQFRVARPPSLSPGWNDRGWSRMPSRRPHWPFCRIHLNTNQLWLELSTKITKWLCWRTPVIKYFTMGEHDFPIEEERVFRENDLRRISLWKVWNLYMLLDHSQHNFSWISIILRFQCFFNR